MRKFSAAVVFVLLACGKRGDPHPPVPVIPKATSDLVVAQRGPKLVLSWSYPSLTTSGQKLGAIRRVAVYRYVEELPAAQPPRDTKTLLPGDIDPTVPPAVALFAKIPPIGPMQFAKLRERVDAVEGAGLTDATVGARLVYEDAPPFQTLDGRPVRINYAVVTEGQTAKSESSNMASIVPVNVAVAPPGLKVEAKAEGVVLTWTEPDKAVAGDQKPVIVGYDIYRYGANAELDELAKPVNGSPITKTTYTDVPGYGQYNYRVSAVSAVGPPKLDSELSEAASATFKDLMPPPTPTGFTALVEPKTIRLVWDAVDAPDLAGYKIYRTELAGFTERKIAGRFALTGIIKETNYRDMAPNPGIEYIYELASVDKNGNESATVKTAPVFVPKTP